MNIFVAHEIYGVGGDFDFTESSNSVLSGIVSAKAADYTLDGLKDLLVVADGSRTQTSYASLPPTSYLYAGVDIDDRPLFDVSPNIWAGGSKGASTAFSFSAWGIANPRGYPSAHAAYVGSDVAWLENDGAGNFILKFVTPGGKPALTYGAKSLEIGNLDADFYSEFVVFSDTWPVNTGLGNSSVMRYDYAAGTFNEFSVSTPTAPHAQGSPRAGTCAKLDGDNFVDILVANHDNSPYLYWFKNPGTGIILDSHYQPVNVSDVDISTPQVVWAGKFDADAFNDIVVGRDLNGSAGRLTLLTGTDGTGTNFSVTHITASPWPVRALAVTDMNGDGLTDIVAGGYPSGAANPSPLTIFFSQAGYVGWTAVSLPNGGAFSGQVLDIQVADFNNDTIKDVAALFSVAGPADGTYAAQGKSSNVHLWSSRNSGGSLNQWFDFGLAEPRLPASAYAPGSTGGNLVIADFDSSGNNDVVRVANRCPAVFFENAWQRQRKVRIRASVGRGSNRQESTAYLGTSADGYLSGKISENVGTK